MPPAIVRRAAELRKALGSARVALTPTMGALHEGHLSLARIARRLGEASVVSIYVNPAQFSAGEDYESYPRDLAEDCKKLDGLADFIFAPDDLYPAPQQVKISLPPLAGELCGAFRPGFFEGVALAVCKLFNCVRPHAAVFGRKDLQQLHIVRLLAAQLCFPVEIADGAVVREADGLAMSSRNAYLSAAERKRAAFLPQTLRAAAAEIESGEKPEAAAKRAAAALAAKGFGVQYAEARDAATLGAPGGGKIALLAAAVLGKTRLIDNIECAPPKGGEQRT
ncbi:MAG: pantoate--beta-alanine ligase [Gammaproteobacteria bacterium]